MNRIFAWFSTLLAITVCNPVAVAGKRKQLVQVYGIANSATTPQMPPPTKGTFYYYAFLILPDGSRLKGLCTQTLYTPCDVEFVPIEKRVKIPCDLLKKEDAEFYHPTCYRSEWYESERKNNAITIRTPVGRVTYSITESW